MPKKMCTGPLFPISSYSALFIPLKPSFLRKGHQSSIICIIFIKILQIFFIILSTSLKIGIQITLCRKMWLLSRSALAQRSSGLLLRSACLYQSLPNTHLSARTDADGPTGDWREGAREETKTRPDSHRATAVRVH